MICIPSQLSAGKSDCPSNLILPAACKQGLESPVITCLSDFTSDTGIKPFLLDQWMQIRKKKKSYVWDEG